MVHEILDMRWDMELVTSCHILFMRSYMSKIFLDMKLKKKNLMHVISEIILGVGNIDSYIINRVVLDS